MNRFCRGIFLIGLIYLFLPNLASAQTVIITGPKPVPASSSAITAVYDASGAAILIYPGNFKTNVIAQVGQLSVNLSGLASPNASVILSDTNGQFLRSTTADATGNFTISNLNVKTGTTDFCFEAVDFKRLGQAEACANIPPAQQNQDIKDIFIPPSIGLYQKQINAGSEALVYGYSMPGAQVAVKLTDKQSVNMTADSGGYYEYRYKNVPAGTYLLTSKGKLANKDSLTPKNNAKLVALSFTDRAANAAGGAANTTGFILTSTIWGFLLFLLILLIIIGILIFIIKRGGIVFIREKFKRKRPLHLDWLMRFEKLYGF